MEETYNYKGVGKIFSFLISVLLTNFRLLISFCWPSYCLFFDLSLFITALVSSNFSWKANINI